MVINLAALGKPLPIFINGLAGPAMMSVRAMGIVVLGVGRGVGVMDCKSQHIPLDTKIILGLSILQHSADTFQEALLWAGQQQIALQAVSFHCFSTSSSAEFQSVALWSVHIPAVHGDVEHDFPCKRPHAVFFSVVFRFLVILVKQFFPPAFGKLGSGNSKHYLCFVS
jgi:hypothetical protein